MSAVLIVLDGVLRAESGAAILDGKALYSSLNATNDIVLLTNTHELDAMNWLKRERIQLPPYLLHGETPRTEQLDTCRTGLGLPVAMFITSDPDEVAMGLRTGVTSLLFAHPLFQRAEYRPDYDGRRKPWAALTGEIAHQARLREEAAT